MNQAGLTMSTILRDIWWACRKCVDQYRDFLGYGRSYERSETSSSVYLDDVIELLSSGDESFKFRHSSTDCTCFE